MKRNFSIYSPICGFAGEEAGMIKLHTELQAHITKQFTDFFREKGRQVEMITEASGKVTSSFYIDHIDPSEKKVLESFGYTIFKE